jgi:hypothetical protein
MMKTFYTSLKNLIAFIYVFESLVSKKSNIQGKEAAFSPHLTHHHPPQSQHSAFAPPSEFSISNVRLPDIRVRIPSD